MPACLKTLPGQQFPTDVALMDIGYSQSERAAHHELVLAAGI